MIIKRIFSGKWSFSCWVKRRSKQKYEELIQYLISSTLVMKMNNDVIAFDYNNNAYVHHYICQLICGHIFYLKTQFFCF